MTDPKKMVKIKILFFLVALIFSGYAESKADCKGPTKLINVSVEQVAGSEPTFVYTVTNLYQAPIRDIVLGSSDHKEMRVMPENIPIRVESPQGWEGQSVFVEETDYMHIFWTVKDAQFAIAPGASLGGFKVVMPKPVARKNKLYHHDGQPAVPFDMKKTPIKVQFTDGTCVWGKTVAK